MYRLRHKQRMIVIGALMLVDAIILLTTFALIYFLRFKVFGFLYVPEGSPLRFYSELVFWLTPAWLAVFAFHRLYDLRVLHGGTSEYRRIASASTTAIIMLLGLSFFLDDHLIISRAWLLMVWITSIVMIIGGRFLTRRVLYRLRRNGIALTRVLIIGANDECRQLGQELGSGQNLPGLEVVGFVGERRRTIRPNNDNSAVVALRNETTVKWPGRWMGHIDQVREIVEREHVDEVIVASTALTSDEMLEVVRLLATSNVEIRLSPSVYQLMTTGLEVQEINGLPFVTVSKARITGLNAFLKRTLDTLTAGTILLLGLPLLIGIYLLVKLDSPGPVIYRRRVVGQGGRLFNAFKFRTMRSDGDAILEQYPELKEELATYGKLRDNDPRITRAGKLLRKTSLDELPQLVNVLLGQMSLVGPRMITYREMIKFGRWQSNLLTVKPGLTGKWQVSGRSNLSYEDRVRLDMHYIRNYTIWLDLQILFQTIPAVLRGSGAY
jgi:exopolysaccharide biosynthesis polyprenyl glycosylphosphotransferase